MGGRADGSQVDFGGITVIPCAPERGHMTFPGLGDQHPQLNREVFQAVYERFRDRGVSRSTRYRILTCPKAQAAFLHELR